MTKYNHYARELDNLFKQARAQYNEILQRRDSFREKMERSGASELERAEAKAGYEKALSDLKTVPVWANFQTEYKRLEKALTDELRQDASANPDNVDNNAVTLLNAGILGVDDFYTLAEKYAGNSTMLRLVAKYAEDAAESAETKKDRGALTQLASDCRNSENATLTAWNNLTEVARYCSGQRRGENTDTGYNYSMGKWWEELTAQTMEEF